MTTQRSVTVGIDLGDRYSHLCLLDAENGEIVEEGRIATSREAFGRRFSGLEPMRIAIETGTHSPWVSRILEDHGHEVLVANARKVRLIYGEGRKTDRVDAEKLARLARLDPKLCSRLSSTAARAHSATWRSCIRETRWGGRGRSSSTTSSAARSRPSGLACPSARPEASTTRSPSIYRKNS